MELKIYIPVEVIEYFVRRRWEEQSKGCLCHECTLTKALCLAVLANIDQAGEVTKPANVTLQ